MFGSIACENVNCHQERKFGREMGGLIQVRVNVQIHNQVPVLDKYFNSEGQEFFFFQDRT